MIDTEVGRVRMEKIRHSNLVPSNLAYPQKKRCGTIAVVGPAGGSNKSRFICQGYLQTLGVSLEKKGTSILLLIACVCVCSSIIQVVR